VNYIDNIAYFRYVYADSNSTEGDVMPRGYALGALFTPDYWAHRPGKGLPALFPDGSARFCTFAPANVNNIVRALNGDQSIGFWAAQYHALFNYLRNAP
jgi:hypothetical protein